MDYNYDMSAVSAIKFFHSFDFKRGSVLRFPTVTLTTDAGRVIKCHDTLTEEAWDNEPWYRCLAIIRVFELTPQRPTTGYRMWIYTRWGSCHFDLYFDRRST